MFRFLFFTFILPLVQTLIYNICVGHNIKNARLGIVNDEVNNCSIDFYREKCFLNDFNTKLSCMFIDNLQEYNHFLVSLNKMKKMKKLSVKYFQIDYPDLEAANIALIDTNIQGLIYFTSNYTLMLKKRINMNLFADQFIINSSSVQITLDPTSI